MSQLVVNDTVDAQQAALEQDIMNSILGPHSPPINEANQRADAVSPSFMNLGTPPPIARFPADGRFIPYRISGFVSANLRELLENAPMSPGGIDQYDAADVQPTGRYSTPQKAYLRHLFRLSQESLNMDDAYADKDPLVDETIWMEEESQF